MERDPVLAKQVAREAELQMTLAQLRAYLTDSHLSVREKLNELAPVQEAQKARREELRERIIQQEREKAQRDSALKSAQLEERIATLKNLEALLCRRVERLDKDAESNQGTIVDAEPLWEDINQTESLTKRAAEEAEALKLELEAPQRITPLEAAEVPQLTEAKSNLSKPLLAALMTLGFLLFGFSWWEVRAQKVATAEDVVSSMGLRIVGALPLSANGSKRRLLQSRIVSGPCGNDVMTASVDATCTVLLHFAQREQLRVLMVTSAVSGEGKTTLASHLAVSLARAGRKTVLLDGDLRRPSLAPLFHVLAEPGLREWLRGEALLEEILRITSVPRLSVIPTGPWDGSTLGALTQEHISGLFEYLKKDHDLIVVDSAPVLGAADSLLLAEHVNAVLFSILRGVSRVPAVCAAQQRLAMLGVRMLGAVVSGTEPETSYGGYSHALEVKKA
jgi:capsular exopolysaccharide synthesis family protein